MSNHTLIAEEYRKKYDVYIGTLQKKVETLEQENKALKTQVQDGLAFRAMMKAVNENPVVKGTWDRFMMTLRMTGYDNAK